jgi:hypothetical protein
MIRRRALIRFTLIALALSFPASGAAAQCRGTDKAVELKLTLAGASSETLVSQRIPVCVRHEYKLAMKAGQRLELQLTSPSGQKGMLTLVAPSGEKPADGENAWSGAAAESGTYVIEIATDKTTTYTLKVVLK